MSIPKILAFAGSSRRDSFNKKLVKIEHYALQTIDNTKSRLYLVTRYKKQDLNAALKSSKFKMIDKINLAI